VRFKKKRLYVVLLFVLQKLAKQQRGSYTTEGGPPLFVPFGQRIGNDAYKTTTRRGWSCLFLYKHNNFTNKRFNEFYNEKYC
jgi:hypothetical protein